MILKFRLSNLLFKPHSTFSKSSNNLKFFNVNNRFNTSHGIHSSTSYLINRSHERSGQTLKENNFLKTAKRFKKWLPFHSTPKKKKKNVSSFITNSDQLGKTSETFPSDTGGINVQEKIDKTFSLGAQLTCISPFKGVDLIKAFNLRYWSEVKENNDADFKKNEKNVDKSIDLWLKIRVDLTRESIRGSCQLPHGLSDKFKLLVFCKDHQAEEMLAQGADYAGLTNNVDRISKGWLGFDKCIASVDVMSDILKIAKILGPLKLMPNLKSKTISMNLKETIKTLKSGGFIEYRAEQSNDVKLKNLNGSDFGVIRVSIGKLSQSKHLILENVEFFVKEVLKNRKKAGGTNLQISEFKWPPRRKNLNNDSKAEDSSGSNQSEVSDFIVEAKLFCEATPTIDLSVRSMLPNSIGYFR